MVDGKMVDLLQGDSGSFCHYCNVSRDANELEVIKEGFKIEKNVEQCRERWQMVETEEIRKDDPRRAGQCHEPINTRNIRF